MDIILNVAVPYAILFSLSLWLLVKNQKPPMDE